MSTLEAEILKWIADRNPEYRSRLLAQINVAEITQREYSGAGWFVHFRIPKNEERSHMLPVDKIRLNGPSIEGPGLEAGGGCILFLKDGLLDFLEIYAFGGIFPKELQQYKLS
jgi:hypothetical protein